MLFWSKQFDDMETLKEAREDDLRSAGLKMGDIIKIRRVLANQSDREVLTSSLSLSGSSISELEPKNTDMCEAVSSTPKPKEVSVFHLRYFPPKGCSIVSSCLLWWPRGIKKLVIWNETALLPFFPLYAHKLNLIIKPVLACLKNILARFIWNRC